MARDPGVYQLWLVLPHPQTLQVGRLGCFTFPAGRYVYTGSALGGLRARLDRHRRAEKRLHWHIDYLLRHARIERVVEVPTTERLECSLNERVLRRPGARVVAPGFGSSDCHCPTHLVYLSGVEGGDAPAMEEERTMEKRDYGVAEAWRETLEALRQPGLLLATTDPEGNPNVMTIGWAQLGIVWGKPILTVFVRPSRFTYERLESVADFTVNVPGPGMEEAVQVCGSVSGRDQDKARRCGFTMEPARHTCSPVIGQCLLHYECRVVHRNDVQPPALTEEIRAGCYPQGDYHRLYFGEVLAVYGAPDLKQGARLRL